MSHLPRNEGMNIQFTAYQQKSGHRSRFTIPSRPPSTVGEDSDKKHSKDPALKKDRSQKELGFHRNTFIQHHSTSPSSSDTSNSGNLPLSPLTPYNASIEPSLLKPVPLGLQAHPSLQTDHSIPSELPLSALPSSVPREVPKFLSLEPTEHKHSKDQFTASPLHHTEKIDLDSPPNLFSEHAPLKPLQKTNKIFQDTLSPDLAGSSHDSPLSLKSDASSLTSPTHQSALYVMKRADDDESEQPTQLQHSPSLSDSSETTEPVPPIVSFGGSRIVFETTTPPPTLPTKHSFQFVNVAPQMTLPPEEGEISRKNSKSKILLHMTNTGEVGGIQGDPAHITHSTDTTTHRRHPSFHHPISPRISPSQSFMSNSPSLSSRYSKHAIRNRLKGKLEVQKEENLKHAKSHLRLFIRNKHRDRLRHRKRFLHPLPKLRQNDPQPSLTNIDAQVPAHAPSPTHSLAGSSVMSSSSISSFSDSPLINYHRVPIEDQNGQSLLANVAPAVRFMFHAINGTGPHGTENEVIDEGTHTSEKKGSRVLVHCSQGVSRSPAVVTAYLMVVEGMGLDEAFASVIKRRTVARPNPSFMAQLKTLDEFLKKNRQGKGTEELIDAVQFNFAQFVAKKESDEETKQEKPETKKDEHEERTDQTEKEEESPHKQTKRRSTHKVVFVTNSQDKPLSSYPTHSQAHTPVNPYYQTPPISPSRPSTILGGISQRNVTTAHSLSPSKSNRSDSQSESFVFVPPESEDGQTPQDIEIVDNTPLSPPSASESPILAVPLGAPCPIGSSTPRSSVRSSQTSPLRDRRGRADTQVSMSAMSMRSSLLGTTPLSLQPTPLRSDAVSFSRKLPKKRQKKDKRNKRFGFRIIDESGHALVRFQVHSAEERKRAKMEEENSDEETKKKMEDYFKAMKIPSSTSTYPVLYSPPKSKNERDLREHMMPDSPIPQRIVVGKSSDVENERKRPALISLFEPLDHLPSVAEKVDDRINNSDSRLFTETQPQHPSPHLSPSNENINFRSKITPEAEFRVSNENLREARNSTRSPEPTTPTTPPTPPALLVGASKEELDGEHSKKPKNLPKLQTDVQTDMSPEHFLRPAPLTPGTTLSNSEAKLSSGPSLVEKGSFSFDEKEHQRKKDEARVESLILDTNNRPITSTSTTNSNRAWSPPVDTVFIRADSIASFNHIPPTITPSASDSIDCDLPHGQIAVLVPHEPPPTKHSSSLNSLKSASSLGDHHASRLIEFETAQVPTAASTSPLEGGDTSDDNWQPWQRAMPPTLKLDDQPVISDSSPILSQPIARKPNPAPPPSPPASFAKTSSPQSQSIDMGKKMTFQQKQARQQVIPFFSKYQTNTSPLPDAPSAFRGPKTPHGTTQTNPDHTTPVLTGLSFPSSQPPSPIVPQGLVGIRENVIVPATRHSFSGTYLPSHRSTLKHPHHTQHLAQGKRNSIQPRNVFETQRVRNPTVEDTIRRFLVKNTPITEETLRSLFNVCAQAQINLWISRIISQFQQAVQNPLSPLLFQPGPFLAELQSVKKLILTETYATAQLKDYEYYYSHRILLPSLLSAGERVPISLIGLLHVINPTVVNIRQVKVEIDKTKTEGDAKDDVLEVEGICRENGQNLPFGVRIRRWRSVQTATKEYWKPIIDSDSLDNFQNDDKSPRSRQSEGSLNMQSVPEDGQPIAGDDTDQSGLGSPHSVSSLPLPSTNAFPESSLPIQASSFPLTLQNQEPRQENEFSIFQTTEPTTNVGLSLFDSTPSKTAEKPPQLKVDSSIFSTISEQDSSVDEGANRGRKTPTLVMGEMPVCSPTSIPVLNLPSSYSTLTIDSDTTPLTTQADAAGFRDMTVANTLMTSAPLCSPSSLPTYSDPDTSARSLRDSSDRIQIIPVSFVPLSQGSSIVWGGGEVRHEAELEEADSTCPSTIPPTDSVCPITIPPTDSDRSDKSENGEG
ncbi:putative Dual specificity phosphatase, catalytic domain containing protein [Blattamonas nauphoetae]|uniref:Dual specificity phosphatase, catalytic domain containing protein n=1 Tax=Blattamonas nauphoetae TaxID=2049346 RepID=A0ABQ9XZE6_9EUKA|nr:putative Dual specificity phosphatase, catalytic domain containing protein [Blattamonas nauphoetae]